MKSTGKNKNIGRLLRQTMKFCPRLRSVFVCFVLITILAAFGGSAFGQQTIVNVTNNEVIGNDANGNAIHETVFQLVFYGASQGSTRNWTVQEIASVTEAAQYWVDILKLTGKMPENPDGDGTQPVVFSLFYGTAEEGNANASPNGYMTSNVDGYNVTLAETLMVDGVYANTVNGAHATINLGPGFNAVNTSTNPLSQSGRARDEVLTTLIHEMGHALGISSSATGEFFEHVDDVYTTVWKFRETLSRYDTRLRDNNGNSPVTKPGSTEGKTIGYDETGGKNADKIFDMGDPDTGYASGNPSHPTFVGKNTLELWYGKSYDELTAKQRNKGVPIQGYTYGYDGYNYPYNDLKWIYNPSGTLSHIDTTNTVMSWQMYRNYPGFIEIELAVMQDLGYTVERKNFFGKSYYVDGDGETKLFNSTTFSHWDVSKQAYDPSKANTGTYAIGTHLFAKNLNIFQTGDSWLAGAGSAGVRIDGVHNRFTLTSNTSIYNEHTAGLGILVAYGKNHTVTLQQGSQVRVGKGTGHALSFNFGVPDLGDVRGSYFEENGRVLDELNGPLVDNVNISGTVIQEGSLPGGNAPIVTAGLADRIVTRSDDNKGGYRFEDNFHGSIVRLFDNGELVIPVPTGEYTIDSDTARLLVNPNDGCAVIVSQGQTISYVPQDANGNPLTDEEGNIAQAELLVWDELKKTIVPWYDQYAERNGDYKIVRAVEIGEEGEDIYIIHKGDENVPETMVKIDVWYEATSNSWKYGRIYTGDNNTLIYDEENVTYNYPTLNFAPDDTDTDFTVLYYDEAGNLVRNTNAMVLDDYDIVYLGGAVTAESLASGETIEDRLFLMYQEDDPRYDETRPWTWFITADQDSVTIPVPSTAIYIDGTAHVNQINIMRGAAITGDIISQYRDVSDRGTTLTFGLTADAEGNATTTADTGFKFIYKDNINYYESFYRAYVNDRPGYYHLAENTGDYDYVDGEFVYVGAGQGNYTKDLMRWGTHDYDEIKGEFIYVGEGLGRYQWLTGDGFKLSAAGKIDLVFAGGYTEFHNNRSIVDSVTVDHGATFSLSALYNGQDIHMPSLIIRQNDGNLAGGTYFTNNGRFSGEGGIWAGARQVNNMDPDLLELINNVRDYYNDETFYNVGYIGDGVFQNEGTIAPGSNDGEGVGIITISGNLNFTKNGVYELTIGGEKTDRLHSAVLADGTFVDQRGKLYYKMQIFNETTDEWETRELFRPNTTKVTGTGNDLIVVSGQTTMNGTLKVHVLPDSIFGNETTTHTIIQSGSFAGGSNFTNVEYSQRFLAISDVFINPFNEHEAQVKVIRDLDFFEERGTTKNEIATGQAVDSSLFGDARIAFSLGDVNNNDADIRNVLRQMSSSMRANSAMINMWTPSEVLFNRIGWGNGQMDTGQRGRVDWNRMIRKKNRILGQGPGGERMRCGSLWADYINTTFNAESDGNAEEFKISRNGFMFGGEWNLTPYSAVGAIATYNDSKLKQSGDTVRSDDYSLGLYFVCAPRNEYEFKAYIGTGFQEYDFERYVRNAGICTDSVTGARGINDRYVGDTKGNTFNVSLELTRPLMLHPTFILRPTLGLDSQYLWQNAFTEYDHNTSYTRGYGSYMYGMSYKRMRLERTLLRAGFGSETSGERGSLRLRAFYVTRIGGDACATSEQQFVGGGNRFFIDGVRLGRNFLNLGVGVNLWLDGEKTSSFFLDYDSNIYNSDHRVDVHTFSVGLLQNF